MEDHILQMHENENECWRFRTIKSNVSADAKRFLEKDFCIPRVIMGKPQARGGED